MPNHLKVPLPNAFTPTYTSPQAHYGSCCIDLDSKNWIVWELQVINYKTSAIWMYLLVDLPVYLIKM